MCRALLAALALGRELPRELLVLAGGLPLIGGVGAPELDAERQGACLGVAAWIGMLPKLSTNPLATAIGHSASSL